MSHRALLIIPLLFACVAVRAADFKLYAVLTEDARVELSDGAVWQMDKGDVFPVEAYKNQQKNIVLRLGGATFMTDASKTRELKPEEVQEGIEAYRKNVRSYLESTSKKLEKRLIEMEEKKAAQKKQKPPGDEAKAAPPVTDEKKP
jgi:hypothetical protein